MEGLLAIGGHPSGFRHVLYHLGQGALFAVLFFVLLFLVIRLATRANRSVVRTTRVGEINRQQRRHKHPIKKRSSATDSGFGGQAD